MLLQLLWLDNVVLLAVSVASVAVLLACVLVSHCMRVCVTLHLLAEICSSHHVGRIKHA